MRIVLFEYIHDVTTCLNTRGKDFLLSDQVKVVSFHPKVESFLKQKGLPCENTLAFFDNASHKAIVDKTETIIRQITQNITLKDDLGLTNTYNHFLVFHLRLYLNCFLMNIELLHNIHQQYDVEEIICYGRHGVITSSEWIDNKECFLSTFVEAFAYHHHIQFTIEDVETSARQSIAYKIKEQFFLSIVNIYFRVYLFFVYRTLSSDKASVVVPTLGYKFKHLVQTIKQQNPKIKSFLILEGKGTYRNKVHFMLISLAKFFPFIKDANAVDYVIPFDILNQKNSLTDKFLDQDLNALDELLAKEMSKELTYHGIDLSHVLRRKLKEGFCKGLQDLRTKVGHLKDIFSIIQPKFIASPMSLGVNYAMGELSDRMNIESCAITHGTHVPPGNRYVEVENYWLATGVCLNDYKTVAIQSPWMKKFCDYYQDERPALMTGPLIYSRTSLTDEEKQQRKQSLGIDQDKKIILYATTQKARRSDRFYITETLDEFIQSLGDIIRAVNCCSDLHLIIRPHPVCNLNEADFKRLLPESNQFSVVTKGKFEQLLSIADLLISYSSTCIEEALTNDIPVVMYDKWKRYNHFNISELTDAINISENPASYITECNVLEKYIQQFSDLDPSFTLNKNRLKSYQYDWDCNQNFYDYVKTSLAGSHSS